MLTSFSGIELLHPHVGITAVCVCVRIPPMMLMCQTNRKGYKL